VLYLSGTWLGPFVTRAVDLISAHGLVTLMMGLVLMMNLGTISLYDVNLDTRLGISSLARSLGKNATRNLVLGSAVGILLLAALQFMVHGTDRYAQFALILTGMALVLVTVLLIPSRFRRAEAYRLAADAVLYMGFLSLLVR
jgi:4-hydroxybenzoate polyprenyltransferase